jgi:hypothetical protein
VTTTLYDVATVLPSLLSDSHVMGGSGSIAFTAKNGSFARIFIRQGNVYAVDHVDYEHHLWTQLRFEERLSHGNLRSLIRSHKSQRDSLYKLLKKGRAKNDNVVTSLKEYTLGAIDDLYQWKEVKVEWRLGDVFEYADAASTPDLPLSRLVTIVTNRASYKHKQYTNWGFKNDDQFLYGNVNIDINSSKKTNYTSASSLQEVMLSAERFIVGNVINATGYSLYSVISTLDELANNYEIMIENPSGRQAPPALNVEQGAQLTSKGLHFNEEDEDNTVSSSFNREYVVPEPAQLTTQETFGDHSDAVGESKDYKTYDEVINDTTSLEIQTELPPLEKPRLSSLPARQEIPKAELEKEMEAQNDLAALYKPAITAEESKPVDAAENKVQKPLSVDSHTEPSSTDLPPKDDIMPTDSNDLLGLVQQLQDGLASKKQLIEDFTRTEGEKKARLQEARDAVARLENELSQLIMDRETASADYEKAVSVISNLK